MSTTCSIQTCFMGSAMFCHNSLLFHDRANDNYVAMSQSQSQLQVPVKLGLQSNDSEVRREGKTYIILKQIQLNCFMFDPATTKDVYGVILWFSYIMKSHNISNIHYQRSDAVIFLENMPLILMSVLWKDLSPIYFCQFWISLFSYCYTYTVHKSNHTCNT